MYYSCSCPIWQEFFSYTGIFIYYLYTEEAFLCADKLPQLLSSIGLYMKSRNTILSEDICNEFLRPDKYSVIEGMQKSGFGILWPGTNIATRIWLEQAKGTFTEIVTDELEKARAHDGEH